MCAHFNFSVPKAVNKNYLEALRHLPPPRDTANFSAPTFGNVKASSNLLLLQVCRRAERSVVALARSTTSEDASGEGKEGDVGVKEQEGNLGKHKAAVEAAKAGIPPDSVVDLAVVVYINRLSDYLFTAARFMVSAPCHLVIASCAEQSTHQDGIRRLLDLP
jgi:hypothetical protein